MGLGILISDQPWALCEASGKLLSCKAASRHQPGGWQSPSWKQSLGKFTEVLSSRPGPQGALRPFYAHHTMTSFTTQLVF